MNVIYTDRVHTEPIRLRKPHRSGIPIVKMPENPYRNEIYGFDVRGHCYLCGVDKDLLSWGANARKAPFPKLIEKEFDGWWGDWKDWAISLGSLDLGGADEFLPGFGGLLSSWGGWANSFLNIPNIFSWSRNRFSLLLLLLFSFTDEWRMENRWTDNGGGLKWNLGVYI